MSVKEKNVKNIKNKYYVMYIVRKECDDLLLLFFILNYFEVYSES